MGKKYNNNNQLLVLEMIKIYKPVDFDWMSYKITRNNILTFHHITSESRGGLTIVSNGALVTKRGHELLHKVEKIDMMLYDDWNLLFRLINKSNMSPSEDMINESKILKKYSQNLIYNKNM